MKNVIIEDGKDVLQIGYDSYSVGGGGLGVGSSIAKRYAGIFYYCPIKTLYLGRSLYYEDSSYTPFKNKTELSSVVIGDFVTNIGNDAFSGCSDLKSIIIPNSVTSIGESAFKNCSDLTNVVLPDSLTNIGNNTFYGCSSLTSVAIPNSVTNIGDKAFYGCPELINIVCCSAVPPICGNNVFYEVNTSQCVLTVPKGYIKVYRDADVWNEFVQFEEVSFKYQISYFVDGTVYITDSIGCGNSITFPLKEGYTYVPKGDVPQVMPAQDITIDGTFTINTYKLTYLIDDKVYMSSYVTYGDAIYPMSYPVKEGHTFSGWGNLPKTMPANDVTVGGTFLPNKHKVVYKVDEEVYATDTTAYGENIILREALAKEGHTFSGWGEVPTTMPDSDVTVEGSFTVNFYTLSYMVNGEEYKKTVVKYGAEIVPETEPVKEGHTFSGWSEIPETMPAQDVTATGTFTINKYKLTYTVDGEEYASDSITYGEAIVPKEALVKEGHTFSGWSEIPETMPAQDVTVEGTFTINSYTLLYIVDGEEYKKVEIAYGEAIEAEAIPTKEGYIFSGWSEIPETMPANDVTVTGSFEVNGIEDITVNTLVDVYTLQGVKVKEQIPMKSLNEELPRGIYIVNGKKVVVK